MAMEKRRRGMKQRHSDNDICDQPVPRIDAAHEFFTAEFRKVPKVQQRKTVRKHIGDAQRDHDQQQQIEQAVRRHRGQVENAAVKRRQSCARRTPKDRRKVRLRLSAAGRRFLDDSRARGERWLAEAMDAHLTASERAHLIKAGALLDRIMAYSKAVTPDGRK
jgi:hypothetical protein